MFRTQENIPEIYVNESRDFQLLCRAKDIIQGATKYTIDSLRHLSNTLEMNSTLLPLLKSKVGFFKDESLSEDQLRYLLTGFPYLLRYKGSRKAIESAVYLWFRVNRIGGKLISLIIDNTKYEININIDTPPQDTQLLDNLFTYLIPTGYIINYNFASSTKINTKYSITTRLGAMIVGQNDNSHLRNSDSVIPSIESYVGDINPKEVLTSIGTTQIHYNKEVIKLDE